MNIPVFLLVSSALAGQPAMTHGVCTEDNGVRNCVITDPSLPSKAPITQGHAQVQQVIPENPVPPPETPEYAEPNQLPMVDPQPQQITPRPSYNPGGYGYGPPPLVVVTPGHIFLNFPGFHAFVRFR